ncbi:unnamed protein product [Didymodactylos carnosus]|uniref:Uncharacterized protein n=1 Tax=Didymodactylos carnosus TaxID=1234261 RepID=A0A814WJR1_9BILA|nr:unnamed protein product [Didymodactylos carnosus]CAF1274569.1 unnamed protein product [Didymodactylos carnosus]CAF3966949.1 unnamed protein product [Didymodactylos carnosus]CAF4079717.1 unnamed protein product [Didymodactylos carnosus]
MMAEEEKDGEVNSPENEALFYFEEALKFEMKSSTPNQSKIGTLYKNIGLIYRKQKITRRLGATTFGRM